MSTGQHQSMIIDMRQFVGSNPAKDYRDKINGMYDELICLKVNKQMTNAERDQATRRFLRKAATHALNALQETREEFMNKYLIKYHQKVKE